MLLKGSSVIGWLIDWVSEWSELNEVRWGEWVSEAEADREHRRTTSHHSVISAKSNQFHLFCCSQLAQQMYSCVLVWAWPCVTSVFPRASWALSQQNPRVFWFYLVGCLQCQNGNPSCRFSAQGAICHNKLANFYWKNGVWVSTKHGV